MEPKVHYRFHKSVLLDPIVSCLNVVNIRLFKNSLILYYEPFEKIFQCADGLL
jgi:hypothetical protein